MSRTSRFTRTDQKFLSFARSSLWNCMPGFAGFTCRSNAVVFTAFCSSLVSRVRLSVNVSAMRKSTMTSLGLMQTPARQRFGLELLRQLSELCGGMGVEVDQGVEGKFGFGSGVLVRPTSATSAHVTPQTLWDC